MANYPVNFKYITKMSFDWFRSVWKYIIYIINISYIATHGINLCDIVTETLVHWCNIMRAKIPSNGTSDSTNSKFTQSAVNSALVTRDAPIIGMGWLSTVLPIIGISRLVCWYRPIVVYTFGKYKFLFLWPKVNKHESSFHFL